MEGVKFVKNLFFSGPWTENIHTHTPTARHRTHEILVAGHFPRTSRKIANQVHQITRCTIFEDFLHASSISSSASSMTCTNFCSNFAARAARKRNKEFGFVLHGNNEFTSVLFPILVSDKLPAPLEMRLFCVMIGTVLFWFERDTHQPGT